MHLYYSLCSQEYTITLAVFALVEEESYCHWVKPFGEDTNDKTQWNMDVHYHLMDNMLNLYFKDIR